MPSGISIHCRMRSSCGTTKLPRGRTRNSPTTVGARAAESSNDLAVGPAVLLDARDAHDHAVAVHGLGGLFAGMKMSPANAFNGPLGNESRTRPDACSGGRRSIRG